MKIKKIISAITASAIIATGIGASALEVKTYSENLKVYYNGADVYAGTEYQPIIINERAMVRLVPIFEKMGWSNYSYDDASKSASFYGNDITYVFSNDSNTAIIRNADGSEQTKSLDVPATIYNDVFYVPLRAFCEMVGNDIQWNADERCVFVTEKKADENYNYSAHLGLWYYAGNSDNINIRPLTITDNGGNIATIEWADTTKQITFISDNVAEGETYDVEDAYGNIFTGKTLYIFEDVLGKECFEVRPVNADTGEVIAQTHVAYRSEADFFFENTSTNSSQGLKLTEDEAEAKLREWLEDLGTWVAGEENVLVCDGIYNCDGKEYYQFRLRGWVYDHATTLTWYVISTDGTEMFEGQCNNGSINKF